MNKIKNLNITNFILEVVVSIFIFVDGPFLHKYGHLTSLYYALTSFSPMHGGVNPLFGVLYIAGIIGMVILLILQLTSKKIFISSFFVSILQFIAFVLYCEEVFGSYGGDDYSSSMLYYLSLIMLIAICLFTLVSYLYNKKSLPVSKDYEVQTNTTLSKADADELKKYKELLDSGIITQEEFEAKKKQLLGI